MRQDQTNTIRDLRGMRVGRLTVVAFNPVSEGERANGGWWYCRCDCGNEILRRNGDIWKIKKTGVNPTCGCARSQWSLGQEIPKAPPPELIDRVGERIGHLTVTALEDRSAHAWRCRCDCGNEIVRNWYNMRFAYETRGYQASCGECTNRIPKKMAETFAFFEGTRVGSLTVLENMGAKPSPNGKHKASAWRVRCTCGAEEVRYASEVIKGYRLGENSVCKECWRKKKHIIPKNLVTWRGESLTCTDWARRTGISRGVISRRLKLGWDVETALTTRAATREEIAHMQKGPHPLARMITHNGETHSLMEWSRRTGLQRSTIRRRLRDGMPVEKALTPYAQQA